MRRGVFLSALCVTAMLGAALAPQAGAIGFLYDWGESGGGEGEFAHPASVAADGAGSVYVADSEGDRIQKFSETGAFVGQWGAPGSGPGQFASPQGIATDSAGDVYVVDRENSRIQKFAPGGGFVAQWGGRGSAPGRLENPLGIAIGLHDNVFVADTGNDRIEKYSSDGAFLSTWGAAGAAPGQFAAPSGVATNLNGNVFVADSGNDRIQKFSSGGEFIRRWGTAGAERGEFDLPSAVATDDAGNAYVADTGNDRVAEFSPTGKFVTEWGSTGGGPGLFEGPAGIAAGTNGTVFVADPGADRIEAFGGLSPPEYGRDFNIAPVSGSVLVRLAGSATDFLLSSELQVPVGTVVDTSAGRVRLTSARTGAGGTQQADFFSGRFRVLQPQGGTPITVLKLENPTVCSGGATSSAPRGGHGLWGSGKGNFRTVGNNGSATVRGTIWWAQDRCDGTRFRVKRGVVTIRDFTRHQTVTIRAGETYLAPTG